MGMPKDSETPWAGRRCWVVAEFYAMTRKKLDEKVKAYFERWPPQGYDTHVKIYPERFRNGWYSKVRRYSTCE